MKNSHFNNLKHLDRKAPHKMTRLLNVLQNEEITEFDLKRRQIPFELAEHPKVNYYNFFLIL